ncbi:MAG: hypothetical protein ACXW38_12040, partial [Nitrospira sp.]
MIRCPSCFHTKFVVVSLYFRCKKSKIVSLLLLPILLTLVSCSVIEGTFSAIKTTFSVIKTGYRVAKKT